MSDKSQPRPSVKEIYFVASEMPRGEEREAYLQQAAGHDPELLQSVKEVLADAESSSPNRFDKALATIDLPSNPEDGPPIDIKKHPLVGPYKLIHRLGDGGMGEVFVAEQRKPVRRTVALKLIKRGMDSDEVIARFEAERQALAMMDHPNIAKVLDAGQTEDGRPYFVMDLVRGIPITEYCDQHKLDTRARLELLVEVCQAVQHAHQKGIIHRDLKPGNILVELHDVRHVPKVIDFGVAKAINQRLTERTLFTNFSQMVGTPLYMSPEQAELSGIDVDTRSDVYALGVLMYGLLTGTTPFDKETLRAAGFDEMRRMIREDDPPRPSHRISTLNAAQLSTLSERQRVPIPQLKRSVERELDWIVLKALEKDRTRRYESASAFAADIQRYLDDEAVEACPPSIAYRTRKFSRRYRGLLWTSALVCSLLVVGLAVTGWQAIKIKQAGEAAQRAGEKAMTNAAIATAVNAFLTEDLLGQADPASEPDRNVRLRTVLDRAANTVEARFADRPLIEAAIRQTLGDAYLGLGQNRQAEKQFRRSMEIRNEKLGQDHTDALSSRFDLARSLLKQHGLDQELSRSEEGERLLTDLAHSQARLLGPEHPETLSTQHELARAIATRAVWPFINGSVLKQQNLRTAATQLSKVLNSRTRVLGSEHPDTLLSKHALAVIVMKQERFSEAEQLFQDLLATQQQVLSADHPQIHTARSNLALAILNQGRSSEAQKIHRDLLHRQRQLGAAEEPFTLLVMRTVAKNYAYDTPEAGELFQEVLKVRQRVLGMGNHHAIFSMYEFAEWVFDQRDVTRCRDMYRDAIEISRRVDIDTPIDSYSATNLGRRMLDEGHFEDAETLFREGLRLVRHFEGDHPICVYSYEQLAQAVSVQGRHIEAASITLDAIQSNPLTVAGDEPECVQSIDHLVSTMTNVIKKLNAQEELRDRNLQKTVNLAREIVKLRPEHANHWSNLGVALYRDGKWQEAIESFENAEGILKGDDLEYRMFLAMAHWQMGHKELAKKLYAESAAWIAKQEPISIQQQRFRAEAEELLGLKEWDGNG